ncbi:uncharacterized protein UV8b_06789 [Ustilaginoidea virens]|uniref:Uncharacterized protein n=1 Tax=Ustilaginoidea virens TaxID=1159556 RepID=A0A8E5MJF0_USTVR|nr:uncharacterized protein UV8b_06789 [Ustilaginoidea virens]QUC22548.1 hypothetical protein UV8b_06789 [Ustilaginoidea virens]
MRHVRCLASRLFASPLVQEGLKRGISGASGASSREAPTIQILSPDAPYLVFSLETLSRRYQPIEPNQASHAAFASADAKGKIRYSTQRATPDGSLFSATRRNNTNQGVLD